MPTTMSPKILRLPTTDFHEFRAPPPSPIGNESNRKTSFINEDILTEFLEHSLQVPDLVLPDKILTKDISIQNPPEIDFKSLISSTKINQNFKVLLESSMGCFQLLNHGISSGLIKSVLNSSSRVFQISPENKIVLSRLSGKGYGFEEFSGDDETETSEEFVWCKNEGLESVMEGFWVDDGYSNFSKTMEILSKEIEKLASKILEVISTNTIIRKPNEANITFRQEEQEKEDKYGLVCCINKHCRNKIPATDTMQLYDISQLRSDIIRMLVKGHDHSHALCVHICDESSQFHLYSKKGWISFVPKKDAIIVTIGDQIQTRSCGRYKHVFGMPIFQAEAKNNISLAFLYSPPPTIIDEQNLQAIEVKTINLGQQVFLAIFFTLICNFLLYIC